MNFPLLQTAPVPSASSSLLQMVPFLLVFFIFYYFVLLAPMRKQKKQTQAMLSALKKGDRVVTVSGIHGSVAAIEEQVVWVKIADTVKVKMNRSAISSVLAEGEVPKDQAPS